MLKINKILNILTVAALCLTLSSCVLGTTNQYGSSSANNQPLPFPAKTEQGLVYITQPYKYVDVAIIGGAMSDANTYNGSKIYVKSNSSSTYQYVGTVSAMQNLCFYGNPGSYNLKIKSDGTKNPEINTSLNLEANSVKLLGVKQTTYNGGMTNTIELVPLSPTQDRHYITDHNPRECTSLNGISTVKSNTLNFTFNITYHNETPYWFLMENNAGYITKPKIPIAPNSSYTMTEKRSISMAEFQEKGIKFGTYRTLYNTKSTTKVANTSDLSNTIVSIDIELPNNVVEASAEVGGLFSQNKASSSCTVSKLSSNNTINCVVNLLPK